MATLEGTLAFENLNSHEEYNGQSTGKYSIVLSLDSATSESLKTEGVKMREYEGTPQRKFASKFDVPVFDVDGTPFASNVIGRGSKVRIAYTLGKPHPVHGVAPYLNKIKVLEVAEASEDDGDF